MTSKTIRRPRIKDLHSHLVCGICMGYFVDATTINECLHTFCRSCIVKYLDTSNFCPMCDVQIHKSRPLQNLRPDKMLQDLVYKVVPGFYASEMQKRREYYSSVKDKDILTPEADNLLTPELKGEINVSQHYSPDESITLSLEYYIDNEDEIEHEDEEEEIDDVETSELDDKLNPTRRYYKCPAAVCIRILKKLLRSKYGLHESEKVDIIYKKECLPEHFTLIDVGYIFSCKKKGLLKFYFRFYTKPQANKVVCTKSVKRTITDSSNGEVKRPRVSSVESGSTTAGDSRNNERKSSQSLMTSTHCTSMPLEEPEKRTPPKELSPVPQIPSPKRNLDNKDEKPKRVNSQEDSGIPSKKQKVEVPKLQPKPDTTPVTIPKPISQPPKPIQPGLKPPSQTSLLLKQQIAQQREQQKHQQHQQQLLKMQRQMMNQKQAKIGMAKVDNKSPIPSKQIPQLQKLSQKQPMKNNTRPVMPQPTTASIGTQSLPIVSKLVDSTPKQSLSGLKPTMPAMVMKPPQMQVQRPPTSSGPTTNNVSTSTSINRPVSSSPSTIQSQNNHPSMSNSEQRRITNEMIEKNKLRPVVVIERHGNGRPKVKQVPSPLKLHQQMSREFNKISTDQTPITPKATTCATTLTVAPTDSATKVKIVKTPSNSPENNDQPKKSENTKKNPDTATARDETPKGKAQQEAAGVLDLSGKSSRKSDSPCSSVGSPSPPAPKVPSPNLVVEHRKSPPMTPKVAPPAPQQQKQLMNKPKPANNKAHDIMKIAQNCLNEKLPFFRQTQQFPTSQASPPTSQNATISKINSFSYQSLMNDALMRSSAMAQFQKHQQHQQQKSMNQQVKARTQNTQGVRLLGGPRATVPSGTSNKSQNSNAVHIRIPNPTKSSPPRQVDTSPMMMPSRVQARIHDLFPNPQQAKPGPNQAVRHIPNPSLLGRQNAMRMQHVDISPASVRKDEITITPTRNPAMSSPMNSLRKIETLTQNLQRNLCDGKLSAPPSMSVGVVATEASQ